MLFVVVVATLALASLSASQVDSSNLPPLILPGRVNNTTGQSCPPEEVRERGRNKIDENIQYLLRTVVVPSLCQLFSTQSSPALSCSALPTSCPSGFYWIRSSNGSAVQLYCDMDRVCGCNGTGGGWTRVTFLNTTNPDQQCPGDWILETRSREPRRQCEIHRTGCSSATFNTFGISYSRVCGRVKGYQDGRTTAFFGSGTPNSSIDSYYLDGVSLTHGPPGARHHIWSFASGIREEDTEYACPCAGNTRTLQTVPSFVGNDFFCESGNPSFLNTVGGLYRADPLWDGQGCASPPCCELSYPPGVTAPWFCKQLPQTTTDDIEARICSDSINPRTHDTPVQLVELYVR